MNIESGSTITKPKQDHIRTVGLIYVSCQVIPSGSAVTKEPTEEEKKHLANIRETDVILRASTPVQGDSWDLFICHASEDKQGVARPLAEALVSKRLKVWYDEFTLTLGDSLGRKINEGLAKSRFGVVILSPSFFRKEWPQRELDGLTAKEDSYGKTILPIWHNVDRDYVLRYSPVLAGRYAVSTELGLNKVVDEILKAVKKSSGRSIDIESFATRRRFSNIVTRRRFILSAIGAAVVVAAAVYPYLQKNSPTQTLQTTTTSLTSRTQNLVTNGSFEDGVSGWNMGTGATPSTAYVTGAIANSGASSLRLQSNVGVYQDLPPTSLMKSITLSYFVYFEPEAELIPSSLVGLYTPDNSIAKTGVVTRFSDYQSLPDWMRDSPRFVFRQFAVPFGTWIPVNVNVSDWFSQAQQVSFPLTRIGLESSNSSALYYDDVKILIS